MSAFCAHCPRFHRGKSVAGHAVATFFAFVRRKIWACPFYDHRRLRKGANRIADRIEKADTNGDGLLQADEITEARGDRRGPNPERMFERVDANDDGMVDAEEYAEMAERMQNRGDRGRRGDN